MINTEEYIYDEIAEYVIEKKKNAYNKIESIVNVIDEIERYYKNSDSNLEKILEDIYLKSPVYMYKAYYDNTFNNNDNARTRNNNKSVAKHKENKEIQERFFIDIEATREITLALKNQFTEDELNEIEANHYEYFNYLYKSFITRLETTLYNYIQIIDNILFYTKESKNNDNVYYNSEAYAYNNVEYTAIENKLQYELKYLHDTINEINNILHTRIKTKNFFYIEQYNSIRNNEYSKINYYDNNYKNTHIHLKIQSINIQNKRIEYKQNNIYELTKRTEKYIVNPTSTMYIKTS